MTLHEYLAIRDLKPSAFAAELGVPASTITRLINGERSPRLELIGRIQAATGGKVTANDFLPASLIERAPL